MLGPFFCVTSRVFVRNEASRMGYLTGNMVQMASCFHCHLDGRRGLA